MYPIDAPLWGSILAVIAFVAIAAWTSYKDGFSSVGQAGIVIAFITCLTWFTGLPEWTAWTVISITLGLFVAGMLAKGDNDMPWHIAAIGVGLFGKMICAFFPWFLVWMDGNIELNKWAIFWSVGLLALLGGFAIIAGRRLAKQRRERPKEDDDPNQPDQPSSAPSQEGPPVDEPQAPPPTP